MAPSLLLSALLGAGSFTAIVTDSNGKPIAGAVVRMFPAAAGEEGKFGFDASGTPSTEAAKTAETDKKGRFTLPLPDGEGQPLLVIHAKGFAPLLHRPKPDAAPAKGKRTPPQQLKLALGGTLDVVPRCGDDRCAGSVDVWVTVGEDARHTRTAENTDKVTFSDLTAGDAALTASISRGTPYEMIAYAKVPLSEGDAQTVALVLEPLDPCSITGKVTDRRGQPLAASVRAECAGLRRTTAADRGGAFNLTGLPKERCTVFAELPDERDATKPRRVFAQVSCPAKDLALILR